MRLSFPAWCRSPRHVLDMWHQHSPLMFVQELANAYGNWNEKERHLTIETWKPKNWGVHDTSSRIATGKWYWLPSGASHLNVMATFQTTCEAYLEEVRRTIAAYPILTQCGGQHSHVGNDQEDAFLKVWSAWTARPEQDSPVIVILSTT